MDLTLVTVAYNMIMLGVAGLVAYWFMRQPGWKRFCLGAVGLLAASLLVAVLGAAPSLLRAARLLCFGWFGHFSIYLLAVSAIGWRRQRVVAGSAIVLLLAVGAIAIDCFWIEPFWLEVTHTHIESSSIQRELRVAVLADFQTDVFGDYQRESLATLMELRPDVIMLAGDYLQSTTQAGWEQLRDCMRSYLTQLDFRAPLGIYAVGGNVDFQRWPEIFAGLPVTVIQQTERIETDELCITGLSVEDSFRTDISVATCDKFHIVLGHAPNYALGDIEADLLVAGHTHGGQVRLPLLGPVITLSAVPRSWAAGVTKLDGDRVLAVARGVGMERRDAPRLRFLCRPQLLVLDIVPRKTS